MSLLRWCWRNWRAQSLDAPGCRTLAYESHPLIQRLPNIRLVTTGEEIARPAARLAAELRLRGVDAIYLAVAQRLGVPLGTWDEEQRVRGRPAAITLNPDEIMFQRR